MATKTKPAKNPKDLIKETFSGIPWDDVELAGHMLDHIGLPYDIVIAAQNLVTAQSEFDAMIENYEIERG